MSRAENLTAFLARSGFADAKRVSLTGDASSRRYERLYQGAESWIVMDDPSEDRSGFFSFIRVADVLTRKDLSPPAIIAEDHTHGFLVLEDLGDAVFARDVERDASLENSLYFAATDLLMPLHDGPEPADVPAYGPVEMALATYLAFLWYQLEVKTELSDRAKTAINMLQSLLADEHVTPVLTLRDYHAENLIWLPDRQGHRRVGLLDFQDAVASHPLYDLISLTRDVRRDVSPELVIACLGRYAANTGQDIKMLEPSAALIAVQRNLRILGVFARLSRLYQKPQYVDLIPRVWRMLMEDLSNPALHPLRDVLVPLLPDPTPEFLNKLKVPCPTPS
ncbi:aminoglycoside phosphotransferase family protein [Aliiroseovarius crassostreae]|uniref:aminoglycoside phosphotransferase family protein n=1 Tax=Aliiroseovarius crassostreae TaxID=154981 RepID=UPI003C7EA280